MSVLGIENKCLLESNDLSIEQIDEKQRIEDLEEEFRSALKIYLPELLCFINEEFRNCVKNGNNIASIQFAKFYLHNDLHNVFSKFNELFIHRENEHEYFDPLLGIEYIKSGVEDYLNYFFYIPILIKILTGSNGINHPIVHKFAVHKPFLDGFRKISFSSTGYSPDFQHFTPYYVVKFYLANDYYTMLLNSIKE